MHALVLNAIHQPLDYQQVEMPKAGKGETVVALKAAALNHRDVFITKGQYAGIKFPTILGSDGVGEWNGQKVVINPSLHWGKNPHYQSKDFTILGLPVDGTFAEYTCVPRQNLFPMPEHLTFEQAAALPLAGLTAYRMLFSRCQMQKGDRVLITGIGGGVALTLLQMAVAQGAEVFVTSGSDEKIAKAVALGAKGGANYKTPDWDKTLKKEAGGFDVIIDSAGGDGFHLLAGLCNAGARIGNFGGTQGKINGLSPQLLFWRQVSILGSTMGNDREFKQMLQMVTKHEIIPIVDSVYALAEGNAALKKMEDGLQFGKIVLKI